MQPRRTGRKYIVSSAVMSIALAAAASGCAGGSGAPSAASSASATGRADATATVPTATAPTGTKATQTAASVSCEPVGTWDRPASTDLLDALAMLGVQLSGQQRGASRSNLVACARPITVQDVLHGADIAVAGDPGPCQGVGLAGDQAGDPQSVPSPSRYIMAVCHP